MRDGAARRVARAGAAIVATLAAWFLAVGGSHLAEARPASDSARAHGCPPEMVRVQGFCIDRWEVSLVDDKTESPLSPYYPPSFVAQNRVLYVWQIESHEWGDQRARDFPLPALSPWQRHHDYAPRAISRAGAVPQGYLSQVLARGTCQRAGKRLCTSEEWKLACRGETGQRFPYGNDYVAGRCNVGRATHPAFVLHGNSSMGHLDPRLNLVVEDGTDPLLRRAGSTEACVSRWGDDGLLDMVGNLDEWVDDEGGMFVGGFYARPTTQGCDAKITSHSGDYFDYSLGTRCCRDAQ
jgi:hypothetical protein